MKGNFHEIRMTTTRMSGGNDNSALVLAYLNTFIPRPSESRLRAHRLSSHKSVTYVSPHEESSTCHVLFQPKNLVQYRQ